MILRPSVSRRQFVIGSSMAAAAAMIAPKASLGRLRDDTDEGVVGLMRKQASTAKISVESVRGGISVLMGAGGNIAVLSGPDGKVLVDAGISTARENLVKALAGVSSDPIRYLINTHWHFDHTDGNAWVQAEGATVLGHENCRKRLATSTLVERWNFTFPPAPASALPIVTFKDRATLHRNGSTMVLEAYEPAHTDSDISVSFKEADVIHVGDVWWNGHYPFIDYSTGGSIDGTIRAVEVSLARATKQTIIIPGHGPIGNKAQLADFYDMLVTVRERVAAMKKNGSTLAEVTQARPTREYDGQYGHFLMAPADFVGFVYMGV